MLEGRAQAGAFLTAAGTLLLGIFILVGLYPARTLVFIVSGLTALGCALAVRDSNSVWRRSAGIAMGISLFFAFEAVLAWFDWVLPFNVIDYALALVIVVLGARLLVLRLTRG